MKLGKRLMLAAGVGLVALVAAQAVPYGRDHRNPAVAQEPDWDGQSRALAVRACFDCHSNETRWPWYSHVAPVSWLVAHDVEEGRRVLNFSEWQRIYEEAKEAPEEVLEDEMPPAPYLLLHPEARLSAEEKRQLADGLAALAPARAVSGPDDSR